MTHTHQPGSLVPRPSPHAQKKIAHAGKAWVRGYQVGGFGGSAKKVPQKLTRVFF